jgi:transketolase
LPGIDVSTGSLGQGLNFGVGVALAQKQDRRRGRTFVIVGDGELNEGSNWEAIMSAPAFKLGNLTAIVDRNGLQANKRTENLIPLENLKDKWESFGWRVKVVDGHNLRQLMEALKAEKKQQIKPLVVIAKTVRNKGISFQEDQVETWNIQLSAEDFQRACAEIKGNRKSSTNAKSKSEIGFKE